MIGIGNIGRREQTTVVLTIGSTIAEVLLIAVGQCVHLRVPVTDTPRCLGRILEGQTIVLQHIATYKELLGVFGTGKHRVERDSSTRGLLDETVAELHIVGTCRNCHASDDQRHNPCYDFMM